MSKLISLMITLFVATSAFAAELSETDVKAFLADWLAAQNAGSYSAYADMYSKNFYGIRRSGTTTRRLNHDAWLEDRRKMFNKQMVVQAINPKTQLSGQTALIKFEQIWESGTYKDRGEKLLKLTIENGKVKITGEEMLFSNIYGDLGQVNGERVASSVEPQLTSTYTSILDKDCKEIEFPDRNIFAGADSVAECKGKGGWRLFKVYDGDERSWLDISNDIGIWSTADQVRLNPKYFFGYFPNIDYSPRVEWRLDQNGSPVGLIFRVAVTDPNPNQKHAKKDSWLTKLYAIGLRRNEPFFCGTATTNQEARAIADNAASCNEHLLKEPGVLKRRK